MVAAGEQALGGHGVNVSRNDCCLGDWVGETTHGYWEA